MAVFFTFAHKQRSHQTWKQTGFEMGSSVICSDIVSSLKSEREGLNLSLQFPPALQPLKCLHFTQFRSSNHPWFSSIIPDCPGSPTMKLRPWKHIDTSASSEELQHVSNDPLQLRQMHHGTHPIGMHHRLVWQQLFPRLQEIAVSCGSNPVYYTIQPPHLLPLHQLHLHFTVPWKSSQHNHGPFSPRSFFLQP